AVTESSRKFRGRLRFAARSQSETVAKIAAPRKAVAIEGSILQAPRSEGPECVWEHGERHLSHDRGRSCRGRGARVGSRKRQSTANKTNTGERADRRTAR